MNYIVVTLSILYTPIVLEATGRLMVNVVALFNGGNTWGK